MTWEARGLFQLSQFLFWLQGKSAYYINLLLAKWNITYNSDIYFYNLIVSVALAFCTVVVATSICTFWW